MKRLATIIGFLAAVACGVDARNPSLSAEHASSIRDSVRAMLAAFQRYSAHRQWDSAVALYVSDTTLRWVENGRLVMRSSAPLARGFSALPPTTTADVSYDTLEIIPVAPGVASVLAYYHTTFRDSTRGNSTFGGLLTMTIVHRAGGWRFLNGHTSSPPKS